MALTIADIQVILGADISQFTANMNTAGSTLNTLVSSSAKIGAALTASVTLPLLAVGKASIDAASTFDQSMANIRALTGATGDQMQSLSALAIQMGKDTTFGASDAADGMLELLKSGLSVQQVMSGGVKGALDLAAAGGIGLAEAARIGSVALNAFKKDGLSMSDAANILAGAANASAADVSDLSMGLAQASAVASGVGLSFRDTATALALFANNGLKGSDAGTSLKTMLLNLQPQTKQQIALFQQLGLTTADGTSKFFDQTGKLKGLSDIAGLLQGALKGMTDAQRLSTLQTIFGTDAIRAANIIFKEGADGVNNLKSQIGNVSAEEVARDRMNSFKGSVEQMSGSVETAEIVIGKKFIPILQSLAGFVKNVADWFVTLNPDVQNAILIFGGLVAAIGPLLLLFAGVSAAIGVLAPIAAALGLTIGGLTAAFILVPAAIAAVIAVGIALGKHWDEIKAKAASDWKDITTGISTLLFGSKADISTFNNDSFASWSTWTSNIKAKTTSDFAEVQNTLTNFLTNSDKAISTKTASWTISFNNWFTATKADSASSFSAIQTSFQSFLTSVDSNFSSMLPKIGANFSSFLYQMGYDAGAGVGTVVKFFIDLPGQVIGAIKGLGQLPTLVGSYLITTAAEAENQGKWIYYNVANRIAMIATQASIDLAKLPGVLTSWLKDAAATGENEGKWIYYNVANRIAMIATQAAVDLNRLISVVSSYVSSAASAATNAAGGIYNGIVGVINNIPNAFSNIFNAVWSYISSQYNRLYYAAANIAAGFWAGFKSKLFGSPRTLVEDSFINMVTQAQKTVSQIAALTPRFASAGGNISNAFQSNLGMMGSPVSGASGNMLGGVGVTTGIAPTPAPQTQTGQEWNGVSISVGQLVVREDADVNKIAQQLYNLQKDRTRGRGQR